jgi:hypothetical protein
MRWPSQNAGSSIWSREFHVDFKPLVRFVRERPETVIVGLGILLRVVVYLFNRTMWLDEQSLMANIVGKSILDFSEQLTNDQLAPFGFLIVQRSLVKVLGDSNFALRLLPLSASILGLVLFAHLARRLLSRGAALVALVLFALSDDLIYYASEMKPYSLDLAIGLAISLVALDALGKPADRRSVLRLITIAALAPWWSFASAFVIAACGSVLVLDALVSRRYRTAFVWTLIGVGWLAVFAASYEASHALLTPYTTMYLFWDFAFLPNHSVVGLPWHQGLEIVRADLGKAVGILLDLFVNPLNLVVPSWPRLGVVLPVFLLQVGEITLARRSWAIYLLLVLPIALAMVASGYHLYPLHGRLILELVPAFFLLIAQGAEWLGSWDRTRFRLFYAALLIVLLIYPNLTTFYQLSYRRGRDFNPHGDLHANLFVE